ncbi:MAG TPA: universal stress protein [Dissulfurispiraceae bacterium]|nr:universal stress protein [Dissulfurispiraceae bacterium]
MEKERKHYLGDIKTVLLCTDGSEHSNGAIRAAINLARECEDTRLIVLRVIDFNPEFETEGQAFAEKDELRVRDHVELIREVSAEENVECQAVVRRSDRSPYKTIIEEAKKDRVDIIVMGRRGEAGLKKMLMGSTTAKVIAYSPCNVLVVPKDTVMNAETILLATDGSKYSELAEREALDMGRSCRVIMKDLIAVSVAASEDKLPAARAILERVKQHAHERKLLLEPLALVGNPVEVINQVATERDADIIVMGTHGRTGFERVFLGSVAERVVGLAPCAVLIVRR